MTEQINMQPAGNRAPMDTEDRFRRILLNPFAVAVALFMFEGLLKWDTSNYYFLIELGPKFSLWAMGIIFTLFLTISPYQPKVERIDQDYKNGVYRYSVQQVGMISEKEYKKIGIYLVYYLMLWGICTTISSKIMPGHNAVAEASTIFRQFPLGFITINICLGVATSWSAAKLVNEVRAK